MSVITIDFETYYSKTYSLTKLTTEEYVRDSKFEVIGVAVQDSGASYYHSEAAAPLWFSGSKRKTAEFLAQFDWENSTVVAA